MSRQNCAGDSGVPDHLLRIHRVAGLRAPAVHPGLPEPMHLLCIQAHPSPCTCCASTGSPVSVHCSNPASIVLGSRMPVPAAFKITISVNRPPPLLSTIFDDMLASLPPGVPQATVSTSGGAFQSSQGPLRERRSLSILGACALRTAEPVGGSQAGLCGMYIFSRQRLLRPRPPKVLHLRGFAVNEEGGSCCVAGWNGLRWGTYLRGTYLRGTYLRPILEGHILEGHILEGHILEAPTSVPEGAAGGG